MVGSGDLDMQSSASMAGVLADLGHKFRIGEPGVQRVLQPPAPYISDMSGIATSACRGSRSPKPRRFVEWASWFRLSSSVEWGGVGVLGRGYISDGGFSDDSVPSFPLLGL